MIHPRSRLSRSLYWPLWLQYVLALSAVGVALSIRLLLDPWMGAEASFLTVACALLLLVLLVRSGPFLAAAAAGLLGVWYLFIRPRVSMRVTDASSVALMSLCVIATTVTAIVSRTLRRTTKRAEESDAILRAFVHDGPICEWLTDADGRIVYANAVMAAEIGLPIDDILGRTSAELVPEDLARLSSSENRRVLETGESRVSIASRMVQTGGAQTFECRRFPVHSTRGRTLVGGIAVDVTSRLQAEEALRNSEARHRAIFETAPDAIITIDRAGVIESVNPATERLFGYTGAELIGRDLEMLMPLDYRRDHRAGLARYARTGQSAVIGRNRELEGLRKDGMRFPVELSVTELNLGGKQMLTGLVRDISSRRQAEAALEREREQRAADLARALEARTNEVTQAQQQLAVSVRMAALGTLAAGLAHDLGNALMPLDARLQALASRLDLPAEARIELNSAEALIGHLRTLTANLRLFARDPSQPGPVRNTNLGEWCAGVQRFLGMIAGSDIRLDCTVSDGLPLVPIAPHQLTQAVVNLIHNARDAIAIARPVGDGCIQITATTEADGSGVRLCVIDNGCGMTEEERRHCIEPFFTTKDRGGGVSGTGMGLALVHGVVHGAGGTLEIESTLNHGTTFVLHLPPTRNAPGKDTPQEVARLTVEDERIRGLVKAFLASLPFTVADGAPTDDPAADLWITDRHSATLDQARSFIGSGTGRRVVVLGGDDAWHETGATVCSLDGLASKLRKAILDEPPSIHVVPRTDAVAVER